MPKNSTFSTSLTLSFWLFWPCSLSYRNVAHIFGIGRQSLKNYLFKLSVSEGSFILLKCGFHEICQKIVLFSFSGHPNGPKTTSQNKVAIISFGGPVVLKITALSLNWYLIPVWSYRQKCLACQKTSKKGHFLTFKGGWGGSRLKIFEKFHLADARYIKI